MIRKLLSLLGIFTLILKLAVAQESNLELLGRWHNPELRNLNGQIYNDIWAWVDDAGREYAILGSIDSTYFIEVTNPRNPVLRDVKAGKEVDCIHRDFKTYKNYCYGVADEGSSSLQIFDLQYLPDSVSVVYDSDEHMVQSHNIFIESGIDKNGNPFAKMFSSSHLHKDYGNIPMAVFDLLGNPENPKPVNYLQPLFLDNQPMFLNSHDVFVRGELAYLSNGYGGLYIYDHGGADNGLELKSALPTYVDQGYNHSSWLTEDGNFLAFADETHGVPLKMASLENGINPRVIGTFGEKVDRGSIPHNPFIVENFLFVSYYHEGLVVYDVSDPFEVRKYAQYDTYPENSDTTWEGYEGCWGAYPFLPSGNILASDMKHGLFVFKMEGFKDEDSQGSKPEIMLNSDNLAISFNTLFDDEVKIWEYSADGKLVDYQSTSFYGYHFKMNLGNRSNKLRIFKIQVGEHVVTEKQINLSP